MDSAADETDSTAAVDGLGEAGAPETSASSISDPAEDLVAADLASSNAVRVTAEHGSSQSDDQPLQPASTSEAIFADRAAPATALSDTAALIAVRSPLLPQRISTCSTRQSSI